MSSERLARARAALEETRARGRDADLGLVDWTHVTGRVCVVETHDQVGARPAPRSRGARCRSERFVR